MTLSPRSAVSTDHIDYLQRIGLALSTDRFGTALTQAPPRGRRLQTVRAISVSGAASPAAGQENQPVPFAQLLTGLSGYGIPVAFVMHGSAPQCRTADSGGQTTVAGRPPCTTRSTRVGAYATNHCSGGLVTR